VIGWGRNNSGQITIPTLTNIVSIAAGKDHGLALDSDGIISGWGLNATGQISLPAGMCLAQGIAAGANHSLALCRDGTVIGWGDDSYG
jgi:alpha-tubulin suppressor-like RCC1 family protein